jgi:dUTP pyrophosphatase
VSEGDLAGSGLAGIGGVLGREALLRRSRGDPPLVSEFTALDDQLQPNGFDLSVAELGAFTGAGALGRTNAERVLPAVTPLAFDADGWLTLEPGPYQVMFNEIVALPNDLMALGRPRSSLCRSGATLVTAVWDAGYRGRSTALLHVVNPAGMRIARGARLLQLVFFTLNAPTARGYEGAYQGENISPGVDQSRRA